MNLEKKRLQEQQLVWLQQKIVELQHREWFGVLTIKMEEGKLVRVTREESLIPPGK